MTGTEIGFLIADLCSLVPVVVGCIFFKRLGIDRRILLLLFIYNSVAELKNAWVHLSGRGSGIYNVFMLFEFGVPAYMLAKWSDSRLIRVLVIAGAVAFYTLWCVFYFPNDVPDNFPAVQLVESIVLLLPAIYVVTSLSLVSEKPVLKNYRFWFAAIIMIYFASNLLFTYVLEKIFSGESEMTIGSWSIHTVIQIPVYFLYACAFYLKEEGV